MSAPDLRASEPCRPKSQRGLSLIETMVGIVIGLLITLAAIASSQLFMSRQRVSVDLGSSSGDAMAGLAAIEYEAAQAGIGFYANGAALCPSMNVSVGSAQKTMPPPLQVTLTGSVPTLDVVYATALESGAPSQLAAATSSSGTSVVTGSFLPVGTGQQIMLVPAAGSTQPCTVRTATTVTDATGSSPQTLATASTGTNNQFAFSPVVTYDTSDFVSTLGTLQWSRFTLNGTDLVMTRPLTNQSVVMARNVVLFQVDYGITDGTPMSTVLSAWQPANGSWATLTPTLQKQVRAIRVGLVVRSDLPEKKDSSGNCSATSAASPPKLFGVAMTISGDATCYRYKTGTITVPLRNFMLGTAS